MHDALGNALVVEVGNLLAQDEIFQQRRPARMRAQRVLIVRHNGALVGRKVGMRAACDLVELVAVAAILARFVTARHLGFLAGLAGGFGNVLGGVGRLLCH